MTPDPEQMAEKIAEKYCIGEFTDEKYLEFKEELSTALRSYGEACAFEANKKTMKRELSLQAIAVKNARRSALEEAAKVAGLHYENCKKDNLSFCPREIENEIRGLLPPEEE